MKNNKKKLMSILLALLLVLLLIAQVSKTFNLYQEKTMLESEIFEQQHKKNFLVSKYQKAMKITNKKKNNYNIDLKANTAAILSKIKVMDLKLIDFSSSENELNLNIKSDFHSILSFIYYLESEINILKIKELKLKKSENSLFLFLKLEKELV